MTWTWKILDNGDIEVGNPSGDVIETIPYDDGFTWDPSGVPDVVYSVVAKHDLLAAITGDIKRVQ